jgi:tetratricopeptide (TPR) repeat protein
VNPITNGPLSVNQSRSPRTGKRIAGRILLVASLVAAGGTLWHYGRDLASATGAGESESEFGTEPDMADDFAPMDGSDSKVQTASYEVLAGETEEKDDDGDAPADPPPPDGVWRQPRVPFYSSSDLNELQRAEAAAGRGEWDAAAKAYAEIMMNPPVPIDAWYHHAIACLKTGDQETYREICESLLDRVELNPLNLPPINLVAWMCAIGPDAVADPRRPVFLAELLLQRLPDEPTTRHAYLNTIGGVCLRAGRYKEAVKHLKNALASTNDGGSKQDWLLLALAYHHLGRPAEARRALSSQPSHSPLNRRSSIWDRAEIELLQEEVEKALTP